MAHNHGDTPLSRMAAHSFYPYNNILSAVVCGVWCVVDEGLPRQVHVEASTINLKELKRPRELLPNKEVHGVTI